MLNNIVLENEYFYCEHIQNSPEVRNLISTFTVKYKEGHGLVDYLKYHALSDEENEEMKTYLIRDKSSDELVGYFSLKAGAVSVNEKGFLFKREFDSVPGIELANFAMNYTYKKAHNELDGIGKIIFLDFVLKLTKNTAEIVGAKLLYIFALPYDSLIEHYKSLHFARLSAKEEWYVHKRIKPRYDKRCIFMYMIIE